MPLSKVQPVALANSGAELGYRNRIINGAFQVWQRGTTISSIAATGTTATYVADRWCLFPANTGWTAVAQVVQVSGGGLRVNCTTATAYANSADVLSLQQRIEGLNCYDLAGQQVTVSFKVKTNKTGNYGVNLYAADTSAWGTPQSITVSASGVETLYTLTFTAQSGITASTTEGLRLVVTLGANTGRAGVYYPTGGSQVNLLDSTSNYFEIDEVQLEKGSTATSFEYRPYGQELALCYRYYWRLTSVGSGYNYCKYGNGWSASSTVANIQIPFPVTMRATPYSIESGTTTNLNIWDGAGNYTLSALNIDQLNPQCAGLYAVTTGMTTFRPCILQSLNNQNSYIGFSAEL